MSKPSRLSTAPAPKPTRLPLTRTASSSAFAARATELPEDPIENTSSDDDSEDRMIRKDGLAISASALRTRIAFLKERLRALRSLYPRTNHPTQAQEARVTFGIEAGEALRFLRTHFASVNFVDQLLRTQQAAGPSGLMAIAVLSGSITGLECLL